MEAKEPNAKNAGGLDGHGRGPRPDQCRRYARRELARGLPGIMSRFIGEAQKGSIPHAKALMSLAGLDKEGAVPPLPPKGRKKGGGLSELLLEELRRTPKAEQIPEKPESLEQSVLYGCGEETA